MVFKRGYHSDSGNEDTIQILVCWIRRKTSYRATSAQRLRSGGHVDGPQCRVPNSLEPLQASSTVSWGVVPPHEHRLPRLLQWEAPAEVPWHGYCTSWGVVPPQLLLWQAFRTHVGVVPPAMSNPAANSLSYLDTLGACALRGLSGWGGPLAHMCLGSEGGCWCYRCNFGSRPPCATEEKVVHGSGARLNRLRCFR